MALWDEEIVEGVRVIGEHSEGLAVMVDRTLYISGQLGIGKDGDIVGGGTLAQVSIV